METPPNPEETSNKKDEKIDTSKRSFLGKMAGMGAALAAGAAGGIAERKVEKYLDQSSAEIPYIDPALAALDQRHQLILENISKGDQETIALAKEFIEYYQAELRSVATTL